MVFRRKKRSDGEEAAEGVAELDAESADQPAATDEAPPRATAPTTAGPWDVDDVPEDDEMQRIDLGGIRMPVPPGVEVRVEVSPEGMVMAAVAADRSGQIQINAFAAPRLEGIWTEIRLEIMQALKAQGGTAEEADGPFGRELRARIPGEQPGATVPARFVGVDGPRWFVRGLITGPAATDPAQARVLEDVFRNVVVDRGKEAMAPRDPIPLRLPKEAAEAAAAQGVGDAPPPQSGDFNPFERGPEITETR